MRELLFRGKRKDNGEWAEGSLLYDSEQNEGFIAESFEDRAAYLREVIPETVGQYTGSTDKNGKKIFEGDILKFPDRLVVVFWHTHLGCWDSNFLKFTNEKNGRVDMSPLNWGYKSEVIGNIHDNPELLKEMEVNT